MEEFNSESKVSTVI